MPVDQPLAVVDGRPIYDNTATVCVVAAVATINDQTGILAIRRAHNPGAGKLGLPGGFHMRGEAWQTGARREVEEETGRTVDEDALTVSGVVTDKYGHNLIMAHSQNPAVPVEGAVLDGEAEEVVIIDPENLDPDDWAFPIHFVHAARAIEAIEAHIPFDSLKVFTLNSQYDDEMDKIKARIAAEKPGNPMGLGM